MSPWLIDVPHGSSAIRTWAQTWLLISYTVSLAYGFLSESFCTGGNSRDSARAWQDRTCLFSNLCYEPSSGQLLFAASDPGVGSKDYLSVSAGPLNWNWGGYVLNPSIVTPSELERRSVNTEWVDDVTALYFAYSADNIGHFINDELLPIFRGLQIFHLENTQVLMVRIRAADPLRYSYTCDYDYASKNPKLAYRVKQCKRNYRRLTKLLTVKPALVLNDTFRNPNKMYCFRRLISGFGYLSDHCNDVSGHGRKPDLLDPSNACGQGASAIFWSFRGRILQQLRIPTDLSPAGTLKILINNSTSHRRRVVSMHSLGHILHPLSGQRLFNSRIEIKVASLAQMAIRQQIMEICTSTVLVSAGGGGSIPSLFLPQYGSLHIVMGDDGVYHDLQFYTNIGYIDVTYVFLKDLMNFDHQIMSSLHKFCSFSTC